MVDPRGTEDMTFLRSSRIPAHTCAGSRGRLPKQPWEQSRSVQILVLFRKTDFSFNFSNNYQADLRSIRSALRRMRSRIRVVSSASSFSFCSRSSIDSLPISL